MKARGHTLGEGLTSSLKPKCSSCGSRNTYLFSPRGGVRRQTELMLVWGSLFPRGVIEVALSCATSKSILLILVTKIVWHGGGGYNGNKPLVATSATHSTSSPPPLCYPFHLLLHLPSATHSTSSHSHLLIAAVNNALRAGMRPHMRFEQLSLNTPRFWLCHVRTLFETTFSSLPSSSPLDCS